ncbi:Phosphoesterase PA-phosphatase related [Seminavis robusta]|uniref:Phosphoesterase PA-phosphatase related n=1 Tax=Seminavis robusta TaxID=568900 RepID=A0A9N8H2W0_9STRA|nr:Phosphoesterase PA-phosphatase related [Seminavis robusta]|eukprot:Sro74_g040760.1 Phosphoesterase PA-phosphatase related (557) ;mRNA; r:55697-57568
MKSIAATCIILGLGLLTTSVLAQSQAANGLRGSSPSTSKDETFRLWGRKLQAGPPPIDPEIFTLAATIPTLDPWLGNYETPFALRFTNYFGAMWWNCIAVYSTDYTDTLTKTDPAVRVPDVTLHTKANRVACMAQSTATYNSFSLPEAQEGYLDVIYGNNPFPPGAVNYTGIVEPTLDAFVLGCGSDVACLQQVAASSQYSPTIMGMIVAKLVYLYSIEDGYNQLGTDDGCVVSCRAYKDTTGYAPVNDPNSQQGASFESRWEPLLEDNGMGFFYRQEHVAAHIGAKAKFRYIPESDRQTRVAADPGYSNKRISESLQVINLMAQLDDTKKVEVEIFDDKLVVANAIFDSFIGKLASSAFVDGDLPAGPNSFVSLERFVNFVSGFLAAELDSAIIAWKEKISYDLVRPTSIIKRFGGNVTTWAPGGVQEFPSENFEAYKRVMPHSEYVSGSACLFEAGEDYIVKYMQELGLSTTFPVTFNPFPAGSSSVEPGVVPAADITLSYSSIEEMATVGSQSRLNGGMHFEASVPAAKALCDDIGTIAADGTVGLYQSAAST